MLELLVVVAGGGLGLAFSGLRPSVLSMLAGVLLLLAAVGWLRRGLLSQLQRQQVQRLLGQTTSPAVAQ